MTNNGTSTLGAGPVLSSEGTDHFLWTAGCLSPIRQQLAGGDLTILAVARLLADRRLCPEALADFRACVEAMARRWQGEPH